MTAEATMKPAFAWRQAHTTVLFGTTLFVSAASMFMLQPMIGKMLLPLVGGTPTGWIVAMAFFQLALLAGYAAANYLSRFSPRSHGLAFIAALLLGCFFLPVDMQPQQGEANAFMVVRLLAATVGIPFIALSMASSTLQRLFSSTGHASAGDPYFLYAASNLGSFAGLLLYPAAAETLFTIPEQARLWLYAYALLIALAAACITLAGKPVPAPARAKAEPVPAKLRLQWVACAFFPSSLMLGVTMHITTEVLAVPLIWVFPLGLYLLTFVLAFARKQIVPLYWLEKAQPVFISVSIALIIIAMPTVSASWYGIGWHLLAFSAIALLCHMRLAGLRPLGNERQLTDYYLMIAVGGALGGVLNAFIAPLVFSRLAEYPIVLVLSCLLNPGLRTPYPPRHMLYCGLGAAGVLLLSFARKHLGLGFLEARDIVLTLIFALVTLHPRAVIAGSALLAVITPLFISPMKNMTSNRNFFGVIKVYDRNYMKDDERITIRTFQHGSTLHGLQVLNNPWETEPTSYFGRKAPVGDLFATLNPKKIAVMGLGAGTLACYANPSREFTFLEIDPAVIDMAKTKFTYLDKCKGAKPHRIIEGDGRLELSKLAEEKFDLIMLDAFSSDMVPVHLVSLEAIEMYRERLAPGGMIAFNISNQYIKLSNTQAASAQAAGLESRFRFDKSTDRPFLFSNQWLVMARPGTDWNPLKEHLWATPEPQGLRPWTDTYSNILSVLRL